MFGINSIITDLSQKITIAQSRAIRNKTQFWTCSDSQLDQMIAESTIKPEDA